MNHFKYLFVCTILVFLASNLYAESVLKIGTQVPVQLTLDASSKKMSEPPTAIVAEDILTDDGKLAIKRGTSVSLYFGGDRARAMGAPGFFTLRFEATRTVKNMRVNLDCENIVRKGKDKHGLSIGLGTTGFLIWPLLPCYLIKGKNVEIPAGTTFYNVFVAEDVVIPDYYYINN